MNLRDVLRVGDQVVVDVIDSKGISIGDVLDYYDGEFVVTVGRKYITTDRYGKFYKYDIETGFEITDSDEKRRIFPTYSQLVASKYFGKIQREISAYYMGTNKPNPQWQLILNELNNIAETPVWY